MFGRFPGVYVVLPTGRSRARTFSETVLGPTHAAYLREAHGSPISEAARRQLHLGMLACWHLLTLMSRERSESLKETFRREASECRQLHAVRSWALAEPSIKYPRWTKPRPRRDEPIDLGHCFHLTATHLMQVASAL